MESFLAGVIYCLTAVLFLHLAREHRFGSPAFWWPIFTGVIALPTFALIDMTHSSDMSHLVAFLVAIVSFATTSLVYKKHCNIGKALAAFRQRPEVHDPPEAVAVAILLLLFSVAVTTLYFYLVGYNLFLLLLQGLVPDYSAMRLFTYSGDRYFAPGYVNQFKNTLYPIVAVAVVIWLHRHRSVIRWPVTVAAVGFGLVGLLGTGQRVYILMAVCSTLYGVYLLYIGRTSGVSGRLAAVLLVPTIAVYGFMTIAYKQLDGAGAEAVLTELAERMFLIQQEGGLVGFRYVAERGPVWLEEWVKGWVGILPGREGSMIAHVIHGEIYGTTQGTVPLTAVGSAFHNGGLLLVCVLFSGLGAVYSYLYHRYLTGPRTVFRAMGYGALFFYLATYVVGPPESLVDSGVLAVLVLLLLRRLRWSPNRGVRRGLRSAVAGDGQGPLSSALR